MSSEHELKIFLILKSWEGFNNEIKVGEFSSLEKAQAYMEKIGRTWEGDGEKFEPVGKRNKEFRVGKWGEGINYRIEEEKMILDPEFLQY